MAIIATAVEFGSSAPNDCHEPFACTVFARYARPWRRSVYVPRHLGRGERLDGERRRVDVGLGLHCGRVPGEVPAATRLLHGADVRHGVGGDAAERAWRSPSTASR